MLYYTANGLTPDETTERLSLQEYLAEFPMSLDGPDTGIIQCSNGEFERVDNEIYIVTGWLNPCPSCVYFIDDFTKHHCDRHPDHNGQDHCPDFKKTTE